MSQNKDKAINKSGQPASVFFVIELDITGMSCVNCSNSIESYLKSNDGIRDVTVNFATSYGRVEYDPARIKPSEIIEMISELGFNASVKKNSDRSELPGGADFFSPSADDDFNENTPPNEGTRSLSGKIEEYHSANRSLAKLKMITAAVFAVPVFVLNMFFCDAAYSGYIMAILALPVLFYSGLDFHKKALVTLAKNIPLTMDALVSASSLSSYFLSIYLYFIKGTHDVYFDSATAIIAIILVGKFIEEKIRTGARGNITGIIEGMPSKCTVKTAIGEADIAISQIRPGFVIIVKPHQKIPVDGEVISGEGFIENSVITGESIPVFVKSGSKVWGGAQNHDAILEIKSLSSGLNSYINEIEKMLNRALSKKATIQKTADKISSYFVPAVFALSLITLFIHIFLNNSLEHSIINAISVIAIACPCALGLALPVAFLFGSNTGAMAGILFTDPDALNKISSLKAIVLDKTGTITENTLEIRAVKFMNEYVFKDFFSGKNESGVSIKSAPAGVLKNESPAKKKLDSAGNIKKESFDKSVPDKASNFSEHEKELLKIVCSVDRYAVHPVAQALIEYCRGRGIDNYYEVTNYKTHGGMGVSALCRGFEVVIGNAALNNIPAAFKESVKKSGGMSFYASINGNLAFYAVLDEKLSDGVKEAVIGMKKKNIDVYLATGDFCESAFRTADAVLINPDNVRYEVKPDGKSALIDELKSKYNGRVAMIGDGVNDALSLAHADISIAMSNAASITKTAASIILTSGGLKNVNLALALGAKMNRIIMQNFFWAFFYNIILIPLAMAGKLNPMLAAFAMMISSLFVVLNSTRLKRI